MADDTVAARVPGRDSCAVETSQLAALLDTFMADWRRDRPPASQRGEKRRQGEDGHVEFVTAVDHIVDRTRGAVTARTIQRIRDVRYRYTELRVADALTAALERPDAFYDGTLDVVPNPLASREAQARCCGGSLLGA